MFGLTIKGHGFLRVSVPFPASARHVGEVGARAGLLWDEEAWHRGWKQERARRGHPRDPSVRSMWDSVALKGGRFRMPIYVKYDTIQGDVTASGHENWIEVNSFQWSVGRGISSPTGGSADREASAPAISEITMTKATDIASTKLLDAALEGEGVTVLIDFCKTDKGNLEVYLEYTLTNCMISGFSVNSGGDRPSESLSLNFTKVEFKMIPMKSAGQSGDPATVTYDLAQAKVV
jgi:type VI secretion system secreted protein Hcp